MARARHVFILGLVLFNIIVLASSAAEAPKSSASNDTEADNDYEDTIGTGDGAAAASPNSVVAGPIGGPVPPGAFDGAQAGAPSAASSSLHHFSAVAGATAVAGFFYF